MLALAPLALFTLAAVARAQSVSTDDIPSACATDCSSTIEVSTLCSAQYSDSTDLAACFCSGLPSDLTTCATCLSGQGLTDTAATLEQASTQCPTALQACDFSCNFDTCDSTDVDCQCSESYLQNIWSCAQCNSDQGNTGVTLLSDYETLAASCEANNYTLPESANPVPSPTGQEGYTAPTLASTVEDASTTAEAESSAPAQTTNVVPSEITSAASVARSSSSALRTSSTRPSSSASASASASASVSGTSGAEKVLASGGALGLFALVGFFL